MKKILVTGKNSYIGVSLENWLKKFPEDYHVSTVDTRDSNWENKDFSPYDIVFHVAGIAHQDTKEDQKDLYYKINRDLTIAIAKKAKAEGVKQFIFMSSMIVYGASNQVGEDKAVTRDTVPQPVNFYGKSKLYAEQGIIPLQEDDFNVVVLRPPMIYGKGAKGNYPILAKFAKKSPLFPDINNKRSMLHIDNLCEFIRLIIDNEEKGIFFPQNKEYVKTSEMVKIIAKVNNNAIHLTKIFNPILRVMGPKVNIINKVFGNLYYSLELSEYKEDYRINNLEQSIMETET
ncbi:NAD-dependent epimerase/dehydratase family protein [Jeotgalibaca sp. A122]|uniref:NAD-dependent epimerase/dehydratase family protein n=1 Tax=Jeotgalibaca sp. A122 TaxID=3457322 RepID=UPI003FD5C11B